MEPRSRTESDGFTIVEVLVAVTVLVIAMLGAALLFENTIVASGNTRNRVVAANLATEQMENVRGMAADPTQFVNIPQGGTDYPSTPIAANNAQLVNGIQFSVHQDVQFTGQNSTTSTCDNPSTSSTGQILHVVETVTWPDMGGTQPVTEITNLAPPVGVYDPASGSIAVKVFDSTGAVSDNINVQITGPVTQSQQTTTEGCAYFTFIPAGTYTVSVIEGTGVGDQEVVAPAQTASVSVGQTVSLQFLYDTPATIVATLPSPTNTPGAPAHATGMAIGVANTGLQPSSQFTFAGAAGDVTTSPGLFPYASGYTVFAGNCTDNNPLGKDTSRNAFYPTAAPVPIAVPPGGSAATMVPLYTLPVHVTAAGVAVSGATVTATEATFAAPYVAVCTALPGTATSGSLPAYGLTASNATGDSVTSLPLGHFAIKAQSGTKKGTVNVWVKPDGVYGVSGTGAATTKFGGSIPVPIS